MKPTFVTAIALPFSMLLASHFAYAQDASSDWPQILGPNRNGISLEQMKLGWDKQPKVLWEKEVGDGLSGPVIAEGNLIVFHRPKGTRGPYLVVEKLKAADGSPIWKKELPAKYGGGMDGDSGPKATPVIADGFIYCHGAGGELACLNFEDGEIVWQLNTREKFGARDGYFGSGSSPIVIDGKLLLNVGGRDSTSIVGLDAKTGDVLWKAIDDEASYSSPIQMEHKGKSLAIFLTRTRFAGIDPENGKVQFSNSFGVKGPTAVASMPVAFGSKVFANAAYRVGAKLIDLENLKADGKQIEPDWSDQTAFASHYGTPVLVGDHFYGTTGREDRRNGSFRCIEAATGKVVWDEPSFPVAHTLLIGEQLLAFDHQGKLSIIAANPERFELVQTTQASKDPARAIPAFSAGSLFVRTNANRGVGKLIAIEVAK